MRVQAVPIARRQDDRHGIVEVNGSALDEGASRRLQIEQGLLTLNAAGKAANGTRRIFDISLSAAQREVLAATGLRSVLAIDLPAGRHQVRVAWIDGATRRGGAVYVDVEVPTGAGLPPAALVGRGFCRRCRRCSPTNGCRHGRPQCRPQRACSPREILSVTYRQRNGTRGCAAVECDWQGCVGGFRRDGGTDSGGEVCGAARTCRVSRVRADGRDQLRRRADDDRILSLQPK